MIGPGAIAWASNTHQVARAVAPEARPAGGDHADRGAALHPGLRRPARRRASWRPSRRVPCGVARGLTPGRGRAEAAHYGCVLAHGLGAVGAGLAAEAAVHGDAEVGNSIETNSRRLTGSVYSNQKGFTVL